MKRRTINAYFEDQLRAKVKNPRWSWGAVDDYHRIFLRIWKDNIRDLVDGQFVWIMGPPAAAMLGRLMECNSTNEMSGTFRFKRFVERAFRTGISIVANEDDFVTRGVTTIQQAIHFECPIDLRFRLPNCELTPIPALTSKR